MATSIDLRQQRAGVREQMRALHERAESEERTLSAEEQESWDRMDAEIVALDGRIERAERIERTPAEPVEPPVGAAPEQRTGPSDDTAENAELRRQAFISYARAGYAGMPAEQRQYLQRASWTPAESRAMGVGSDTGGGYLVPDDYRREIEKAMVMYGGMREAARVLQTASGNDLIIPTVNDTSNTGEIVGEHQAVTTQDVAIGQRVLRAYMYSSKEVLVSLELLEDSAVDVEALLRDLFAERLGRITNTHFTTGTGADRPTGITIDAVSGVTAAAVNAVTTDELVNLEFSVDRAYRANAKWMFHSNTLRDLKKLVDGEGRFLWQQGGLQSGTPNQLMGYSYVVNDDMPQMLTGNKAILFGQLDKYLIRDVMGIRVLRLNERYAENHQVAFFAFSRHDGKLIDAGSNPVKCITMA